MLGLEDSAHAQRRCCRNVLGEQQREGGASLQASSRLLLLLVRCQPSLHEAGFEPAAPAREPKGRPGGGGGGGGGACVLAALGPAERGGTGERRRRSPGRRAATPPSFQVCGRQAAGEHHGRAGGRSGRGVGIGVGLFRYERLGILGAGRGGAAGLEVSQRGARAGPSRVRKPFWASSSEDALCCPGRGNRHATGAQLTGERASSAAVLQPEDSLPGRDLSNTRPSAAGRLPAFVVAGL